jgi:hypothetical protein
LCFKNNPNYFKAFNGVNNIIDAEANLLDYYLCIIGLTEMIVEFKESTFDEQLESFTFVCKQ